MELKPGDVIAEAFRRSMDSTVLGVHREHRYAVATDSGVQAMIDALSSSIPTVHINVTRHSFPLIPLLHSNSFQAESGARGDTEVSG